MALHLPAVSGQRRRPGTAQTHHEPNRPVSDRRAPPPISYADRPDACSPSPPGEVLHYRDGAFQSFVTLDELRNQLESQELWGAFDGAAFDPDHPERLRLGAAGDYQTWRFVLDADGSLIDARRNEIDSWQTRILPLFGGDWLIGEGKNLKRYITGESYLDLFTLAENETLIGVDGQGGLLTRTLSRLFRYPLSADALPVAADSGLPFPADYPGYLPAIRQVFLHAELGDSPAFLWMQFRPVSDF